MRIARRKRLQQLLVVTIASALATVAGADGRHRSVWDGVYTDEQARRGSRLYRSSCASCHGDKLAGGQFAPPLAGGRFLSNWYGLTLDALFERIRLTMPSGSPERVGSPAKAEILAYILRMNRFPSGTTELKHKAEMMKDVLIKPDRDRGKSSASSSVEQ